MPVSPTPDVRNCVFLFRCCSSKSTVWCGWPMLNGVRLTSGIDGPPAAVVAVPWSRIVVPCGMEASRAIVAGSCGSVVDGMLIHTPGSICSPAGAPLTSTLASDLLQVRQPMHEDLALDQAAVRDLPVNDLQVDPVAGHVQLEEMVRRAPMRAPDGIEALAAPVSGETSERAQPGGRRGSGRGGSWRRSSLVVVQRLEGKVCGQFHDFPPARRGSPVSPRGHCSPVQDDGSWVRAARQWISSRLAGRCEPRIAWCRRVHDGH